MRGFKSYPWKLTEDEIATLLESVPKESLADLETQDSIIAANSKTKPKKKYRFLEIFEKANLTHKVGLTNLVNRADANKLAHKKFRALSTMLQQRPALQTNRIKEAIAMSPFLEEFFQSPRMTVVPVTEDKGIIAVSPSDLSPLAKQETIKMQLLEEVLSKMQMVTASIDLTKIKRSNLQQLTSSLSNLVKVYQSFKGDSSPSSIVQVNIKHMTLEQKRELSQKTAEK